MTDESQEERLPAGYSIEMEDSSLLILHRDYGSVVKRFVLSSTSPTPKALRQAAEEDLLSNRKPPWTFGNTSPKEKSSHKRAAPRLLGFVLL